MWRKTGTLTADGSTAGIAIPRRGFSSHPVAISVVGTWGNGTITVEAAPDGTNYAPVKRLDGEDLAYTGDFTDGINPPEGLKIRLTLSSSSGADLDWAISSDGV